MAKDTCSRRSETPNILKNRMRTMNLSNSISGYCQHCSFRTGHYLCGGLEARGGGGGWCGEEGKKKGKGFNLLKGVYFFIKKGGGHFF